MDNTSRVLVYRWVIFSIMALAYFWAFFHRVCPAVVALDLQDAFGLSGGLMGLLASAYFYGYSLMQFPAGVLSDTLGPRKAVSLFLVVGGAGSIFLGAAPDLGIALFGRVLVGVGAAMVFTTMKIVSQWFRVREFSRMAGLLLTAGGLGALAGAGPMAVLSDWVGWRLSFEGIGIATIGLAIAVFVLVRNRPGEMGLPTVAELDYGGVDPLPAPEQISLWQGVRRVVTEKRVWPVIAWAFLTTGTFFGFGGLWAGPYLMDMYHMTRTEAGSVLNMIAVGLILGSPFVSFVSDNVLRSRKQVLMLSSICLVVITGILHLFPRGLPIASLYVMIFVFTVCSSAAGIIAITAVKELFPLEITGTAIGTANQFPFLGAALMQLTLGRLLDTYPRPETGSYSAEAYSGMFAFMLIAVLISVLCAFFTKETYPDAHFR
ncbi:MAG: MFS transporter [Deltaproteobacteria bacterium]